MKRKRVGIVLLSMTLGPVATGVALILAGGSHIPHLHEFVMNILALPWFWVSDYIGEASAWFLLIGGSGLLYGLIVGLLLARRIK